MAPAVMYLLATSPSPCNSLCKPQDPAASYACAHKWPLLLCTCLQLASPYNRDCIHYWLQSPQPVALTPHYWTQRCCRRPQKTLQTLQTPEALTKSCRLMKHCDAMDLEPLHAPTLCAWWHSTLQPGSHPTGKCLCLPKQSMRSIRGYYLFECVDIYAKLQEL